jgi:hypothetical protein
MISDIECIDLGVDDDSHAADFDVVFVHGIDSSAREAWTSSNGDLWPLWLKPIFKNARILLLNYPAPAFFSSKFSPTSIQARARNLADFLPTIGIGNRATIFVCHSLGGIIVKEILRSCVTTGCSLNVAINTIGLVFLATPHSGADLNSWMKRLGSTLIGDLGRNTSYIMDLKAWFSQHAADKSLFVAGYYEMQPYKGIYVVDKDSSDPAVSNCTLIGLDADHCSIAKPKSPTSDLFKRVVRDIRTSQRRLEAMSKTLLSIEAVIRLPDLTNGMYFELIHTLNVLCASRSQKAVIISDPGASPKPRCVIISQDRSFVEMVAPLQERFPDRFRVEEGVLGELSGSEDMKTTTRKRPKLRANKRTLSGVTKVLSVAIDHALNIKPTAAWRVGDEIWIITALHVIDAAIYKLCDTFIKRFSQHQETHHDVEFGTAKHFKWISTLEYYDQVAQLKNEIYGNERFSAHFFDYNERRFESRFTFSIQITDFLIDLAVLKFSLEDRENTGLEDWCRGNKIFFDHTVFFSEPRLGDWCTTPEEPAQRLRVDRRDEIGFFPVHDKVTKIADLIVLSGAEAKLGTSGAPVYDTQGKLIAMIIGRTNQAGEYKYLAVGAPSIEATLIRLAQKVGMPKKAKLIRK